MKPSKKKIVQEKKGSKEKINDYFQLAAKEFNLNVDEENVSSERELKAVYIDALKQKLQGKLVSFVNNILFSFRYFQ